MKQAKKNSGHLEKHQAKARRDVLACYRPVSLAITGAVLVAEIALFFSDFSAFTALFGQAIGDSNARPVAIALSLMVPVFTYVVVAKLSSKISEKAYDRALVIVFACLVAFLVLCVAVRFPLEQAEVSAEEGVEDWVTKGLAYSLPLVAAMIGSAAGALAMNDPRVKRAVAAVKCRFRIAELEAEKRALEENDPSVLSTRLSRCLDSARDNALAMMRGHLAMTVLSTMDDYTALENVALCLSGTGNVIDKMLEAATKYTDSPRLVTAGEPQVPVQVVPHMSTHEKVVREYESEKAAASEGDAL